MELQQFALLIKSWQGPPSELSFADFLNSVTKLYGTERNYLLVGQYSQSVNESEIFKLVQVI